MKTSTNSGCDRKKPLKAARSWFILSIVCAVLVIGCTNSKLVLRPLYNSLDDRMQEDLLEYGALTAENRQEIRDTVDHFHVWHRKTQLPTYMPLLWEVVGSLRNPADVEGEQVAKWSRQLRGFTETIGKCNPFYLTADMIAGFSNKQVADLKLERITARNDWRERRQKRRAERTTTREERVDESVSNVRRYVGLAGLKLTDAQAQDMRTTMLARKRLERRFGILIDELDDELFALIDKRKEPGWEKNLTDHIDYRRQRFADWSIERFNYNRQLWEDYAVRLINSFSDRQRRFVADWLDGLARTVGVLAADEPGYKGATAESYPCKGVVVTRDS